MNMKIFVDFDNTIFDTRHQFLDDFFGVFDKYGVSREIFDSTLSYFSKTSLQTGECYSPESHIREINKVTKQNIDERQFLQEMEIFLEDLEKYVFEDFYEFANNFDKKNLIILSYGDSDFQSQKISGSGVKQFFEDAIITQGDKTKEIEKYMQKYCGRDSACVPVIIDDKFGYFESAKNSQLNIKTIHNVRGGELCDDSKNCDKHVKTLREIKKSLS